MMKRSRSRLQKSRPSPSPTTRTAIPIPRDNISEAAQEHRQSLVFRPKSAGNERRRQSFSRPWTSASDANHSRLDINDEGPTMDFTAGNDTFNFPTPRSAALPASASPVLKHAADSPAIGVALGSPSQPPPSWTRSLTADHISYRMPRQRPLREGIPSMVPEDSEYAPAETTPEVKKKKTGWKALGNLFRSKSRKSSALEPFHEVRTDPRLQPTHQPSRTQAPPETFVRLSIEQPPVRSSSTIVHRQSDSPSWTRGLARLEARSVNDRASLLPYAESQMHRTPSQRVSMLPSPHYQALRASIDMFKPDAAVRHDSPISDEPPKLNVAIPRTPRLDLEIPAPELERYSVMFGKLLADEPKPTLLERRQSRKDRIRGLATKATVNTAGAPQISAQSAVVPQRSMSVITPESSRAPPQDMKNSDRNADRLLGQASATAFHRPRPKRSLTAPTETSIPAIPTGGKQLQTVSTIAETSPQMSDVCHEFATSHDPTRVRPQSNQAPSTGRTTREQWLRTETPILPKDQPPISKEPPRRIHDHLLPSESATPPRRPSSRMGHHRPDRRPRTPQDSEKQVFQVSIARQVSVSGRSRSGERMPDVPVQSLAMKPRVVELGRSGQRKSMGVVKGGE